jgi:hypothetical protein
VRYIGADDAEATAAGLAAWHDVVAGWLSEGRAPTLFVHTPENRISPALARGFHDALRARLPGLDPLPDPLPVRSTEQGSLF